MQNEVLNNGPLLDENGELIEKGYARHLIKDYDRNAIKAKKRRIKEWDYYLIYNEDYGIALTVDDNSYMGLVSVSVIDFKNKTEKTTSPIKFFTNGKTNLPPSSKEGDVIYKSKRAEFSFIHEKHRRILDVRLKKFNKDGDFVGHFVLTDEPEDSMVIITPFAEDKKAFYYNQKIVGFQVEGAFIVGGFSYEFHKNNTRAILDWGRGVWTYKNTWYWGAGAGKVDGREVGFNIGYGFGDTSNATENVLFVDGRLHKLSHVRFEIPKKPNGKNDYLSPWKFTSDDGRFEMDFVPLLDRAAKTDIGIICSDQHQVFGHFTGDIILDDGKKLHIDNFLAFAEHVYNKW